MVDDGKTLYYVRERLYDRRQVLLTNINTLEGEYKEIYNPHDFSSGEYRGTVEQTKNELHFIEKLINDLENAYFV